MKKILPSLLLAFALILFFACEKDDICVNGDTPLLVFRFYDATDTTETLDVPSLRVREVVLDEIVTTFTDRSNSRDSIGIPLRIVEGSTQYAFIRDSEDDEDTGEETGNIDTLTITYQVREAYVSKACGFVANFDELTVTLNGTDEKWIQDFTIEQETVENTNAAHVKIFH
ncbi:DUF6452 family protein [Flagellimonas myxillae]|uniref:DUF6452 family protein n=1 Tax=Flagellimonas myxillae TaxID=2942214 RepID=UPI00201E99F6|nr:DUF6452 family protein [Muricauda myxillae]MCL6266494.1 DUF6452 family protein [Muricauda myxillae]